MAMKSAKVLYSITTWSTLNTWSTKLKPKTIGSLNSKKLWAFSNKMVLWANKCNKFFTSKGSKHLKHLSGHLYLPSQLVPMKKSSTKPSWQALTIVFQVLALINFNQSSSSGLTPASTSLRRNISPITNIQKSTYPPEYLYCANSLNLRMNQKNKRKALH